MNIRFLWICLLLISCQSSTGYKDAEKPSNEFGYTETKLSPNFYRVSFEGNFDTDKSRVEKYMIYRAAELALKKSKDFIKFIDKDLEKDQKVIRELSQYRYRSAFGAPGASTFTYPYYYSGAPTAGSVVVSKRVKESFKAISYVKFYSKDEYRQGMLSAVEIIKEIDPKR